MKIPVTPILITACLSLSLVGCVESDRSSTPSGGAAAECPWEADPNVTTQAKLAWQASPTGDLIVKDMKLLETCMPNAKITWSQFGSGADVIQAFGANGADLGLIGSSPATIALSQPLNLPIKVVWIQEVIGAAESLVARDPGITTVAQLKGKRIAVPFSSTAHYSLLQALDGSGLKPGTDVDIVNLAPDAILAAWQGNQIDAAWIWNPALGKIQKTGHVVTSSADTAKAGKPTFDLSAGTAAFIDANAAFMKQWATAQDYAVELIQSDPKKASESIAIQMGISPQDAGDQLSGYTYLRASDQAGEKWLGGQVGKDLIATAKFLLQQGSIKAANADATYIDAVDPAPAASVAK